MDASFWDVVKSVGSSALHAGERVAADAAKREIARRLGEEDLSFWDVVKHYGGEALHAGERVAADAAKREIARRLGE